MRFLSYTLIRNDDLEHKEEVIRQAVAKIATLEKLRDEYQHQVKTLREFRQEERLKDVIDVDIGDPTPDNPDARKAYVGRVAGFYRDILQKKCLQMISVWHRLLEEETNDRETDLYLKIGVFICRDLMKWGDAAISEQMSYQTETPPTPAEMQEEVITQVKL